MSDQPAAHTCIVCQRRQYERAHVCEQCRTGQPRTLHAIVDLHRQLDSAIVPPRSAGAEPVSGGGYVAPLPVNADALDLAAPARPLEASPQAREHPDDQIGHTSVAGRLCSWVDDWIDVRNLDEHAPVPTVPALASWLTVRWDWACDSHPAVDEYVTELRDLERTLRAVTGVDRDDTTVIGSCPGLDETCGATLRATPWQTSVECPRCETRWQREMWTTLGQHMRRMRAAT